MAKPPKRFFAGRSLISFWVFGLCNNFAYVVMLSAAQDILRIDGNKAANVTKREEKCVEDLNVRDCSPVSAGLVLICNIIPSMIVKMTAPFYIHYMPYGVRHFLIVLTQAASLVMTALATGVGPALAGVAMASLSSGLGEITYLALASHYSPNTISTWSSGTGMAGIAGALSYAGMTDPKLLGMTPKETLLAMLLVPLIFAMTYYVLLVRAPTVQKSKLHKPSTWIERKSKVTTREIQPEISESSFSEGANSVDNIVGYSHSHHATLAQKLKTVLGLLKYMIPLGTVYFAQYFINQGLAELIVFDCSAGMGSTPEAQYRWYQVLYQVGVFLSRSSINLIQLPFCAIASLPVVQLSVAGLLLVNALSPFLPHILVMYTIIFFEGIVGGASYVNTMHHIHRTVPSAIREFCLLVVSVADSFGILAAATIAIPIHNKICHMPYLEWFE